MVASPMVSSLALTAMAVSLLLSTLLPLFTMVLVARRWKNSAGAILAGGLTFFISQMLLRLPLLQILLPRFVWFKAFSSSALAFPFFLAFSAALFEESGRLLAFRLLLKDRLAYRSGIAFGLGHGGIEAILIVGLTYLNNLVFSLMLNAGRLRSFLDGKLEPALIDTIESSLIALAPSLFLAAGVERVLTIVFHIGLSVLILEGLVNGHAWRSYSFALLAHGGVNFLVSLLLKAGGSIWLAEAFMAIVAGISAWYILGIRRRFGDKQEARDEACQAIEDGY